MAEEETEKTKKQWSYESYSASKRRRGARIVFGVIGAAVIFFLYSVYTLRDVRKYTRQNNAPTAAIAESPYLKDNIYQLQSEFNTFSSNNGLSFNIGGFQVEAGGIGKVYKYEFSKDIIMMGDIDNIGRVTSCMIMSQSNTYASSADILLMMLSAARVIDNALSKEECANMITDLVKGVNEGKAQKNGISYSFFKMQDINTFTITKK